MIYCLYNTETNALLGVSETPVLPGQGQEIKGFDRALPDFSREYWNTAVLDFDLKGEALLSKREFVKRFTPTEYATIKAAAAQNATLDYYWQMFMLAEFITLSDPDTIAGVVMLEQAGLIGSGRAAEILA